METITCINWRRLKKPTEEEKKYLFRSIIIPFYRRCLNTPLKRRKQEEEMRNSLLAVVDNVDAA